MFRQRTSWVLIVVGLNCLLNGCVRDDEVITPEEQFAIDLANVDPQQLAIDSQAIDTYLLDSGIVATTDPTGLRYVVHDQGTGIFPELVDFITVRYEGRLLDGGTAFDDSDGIEFLLNDLLLGWKVGLKKLNAGGSVTLYIPSGLAYAGSEIGGIPANSILIFEIDLLGVRRAP